MRPDINSIVNSVDSDLLQKPADQDPHCLNAAFETLINPNYEIQNGINFFFTFVHVQGRVSRNF